MLKQFFTKYTITTHSLAAAFAFLVAAYAAVPAFHALVVQVYNYFPALAQQIVMAAFGLYAWYRNGEASGEVPVTVKAATPQAK